MKKLLVCVLGLGMLGSLSAQLSIRNDDHFWRRKVVNRLDLGEKINRPLVEHASTYYQDGSGEFSHTNGVVSALMAGLKEGRYQAYHPEDWKRTMNYQEVVTRAQDWNKNSMAAFPDDSEPDFSLFEDPPSGEENLFEEADQTDDFGSTYFEDEKVDEAFWETGMNPNQVTSSSENIDLMPFEEVIHIVEDWVFDKNRSMMVQQLDFFEVIWVDPMGVLPEKILARFLWEDVQPVLDQTMWHARFNDATSHSIADAITLRLFHSYPISIGGHPITSLEEADRRFQEMIEFESYLWSY